MTEPIAPDLNIIIKRLADGWTPEFARMLYEEVLRCELGLLLVETVPGSKLGETHIVQSGENIQVRTAKGPNGKEMLLAFVDPMWWYARNPKPGYVGVKGDVALKMAISGNLEGIVINSTQNAWTCIPKSAIVDILAQVQEVKE